MKRLRLMDAFKTNLSAEELGAFRLAAGQCNLGRGRLFSPVMVLTQGILFMIDLWSCLHNRVGLGTILICGLLYLAQVLCSLLLYVYVRKRRDGVASDGADRFEWAVCTFVSSVLCLSSAISLLELRVSPQVLVYMVNLSMVSAVFYLDARRMLLACGAALVVLFAGLPFFRANPQLLLGDYFSMAIFTGTAFFVSRILYASFARDFQSGELLRQTNEQLQNEILNNRIANSELLYLNQYFQEITMVDELTGIPNRRSLQNYFDITCGIYHAQEVLLSVILIDIDKFKSYNDVYGHLQGDEALKKVAHAINTTRRSSDFVARFGGEEFVFATFNTPAPAVRKIAERIRKSVSDLRIPHENSAAGVMTISLGTCTRTIKDKEEIHEVIRQADEAMYRAKSGGRNCVECC